MSRLTQVLSQSYFPSGTTTDCFVTVVTIGVVVLVAAAAVVVVVVVVVVAVVVVVNVVVVVIDVFFSYLISIVCKMSMLILSCGSSEMFLALHYGNLH